MPRFATGTLVALILCGSSAAAQTPELEVQVGAGYVGDSGEGPSVPTASAGAILWLTRNVGIAGRLLTGIGDDHFEPPTSGGDRTFLGPGSLRLWTATVEGRWSIQGIELNVGLGWGGHSYEYKEILTGIRRADGSIDPITPMPIHQRYRIGLIASEVFVGRPLGGAFHVKAGFTYGLAGDVRPFQPLVLLAVKTR